MRAILDVGANDGSWSLDMARRYPEVPVFGFEPTPRLGEVIRQKIAELGLQNYELIPVAVSDEAGTVQFNVAGVGDWGCSSLLSFNKGLDKTWPGREDCQVTETISVECIRLDAFVEARGITSIAFLHCDAQGVDLKVIASLGKGFRMIERGRLETARSPEVALYEGQHTIADVLPFLWKKGFEIESLTPNDLYCNELNVTFRRAPDGRVRIK